MTTSLKRREFLALTGGSVIAISSLDALTTISRAAVVPVLPVTNTAYKDIENRAITLLGQLERGLSYAGYVREWVPRRDISDVVSDGRNISKLVGQISEATRRLEASEKTVAEEITSATDSLGLAQKQLRDIQSELRQLNQEWRNLNGQLPVLDLDLRRAKDVMLQAQQRFQDAVRRASARNCGFGEIVMAIGALVAVGTGTMAALGAISTAAGQLATGGITLTNLKLINNTLEPAKSGIESIRSSYNKIKPLLDNDAKGAMVSVETNGLNERLQSVLNEIDGTNGVSSEEKENFKRTVRDYAAAVETRNNAILRLDSIAIKIADLAVREATGIDLVNRLSDHIAQSRLLSREELVDLMRRVNRNALRKLRDYLWLAQRAMDYSALRVYAADIDISSDDHALLANSLLQTEAELSVRLMLLGGPAQQFPINNAHRFTIRVPLSSTQLRQLRENGTVLVSLHPLFNRPDGYERAVEVYANAVQIRIDRTDTFDGYLTHLRTSRFLRQSGDLIQYQLSPTLWKVAADVPIKIGSDDAAPVGKRYLGLSPFSDWMLSITHPKSVSRWADYIEFEFAGTMRTI